jgi:cell shape-determining protein MreC
MENKKRLEELLNSRNANFAVLQKKYSAVQQENAALKDRLECIQ